MKKIIILFSTKNEDLAFASKLATITECEFLPHSSFNLDLIDEHLPNIAGLFFDIWTDQQLQEFEERFASRINKNIVHSIVEPKELHDLSTVFRSPSVGHIVIRRYDNIDQDAELYSKIVRSSQTKELRGLKAFFPNSNIKTIQLCETKQRGDAVQLVLQRLVDVGAPKVILHNMVNAVDELLMNAMFDSKVDSQGKSVYRTGDRNTNISLDSKSLVELQFAIAGSYMGVTVIDLMGTLDRIKVLSHIAKSYSKVQTVDLNLSSHGSGIGLSMILKSGGSLCLACQPGLRTEATIVFKITNRMLEFKRQFQFISTQFVS